MSDEKKDIKKEEKKDKTIQIKQSELERLVSRLDRLEYAANKARTAHFDKRNREAQGKLVNLTTYEGKAVVGWRMLEDLVEKDPRTMVWNEIQTIELTFEDGDVSTVPYATFVRRYKKIEGEVISEIKIDDKTIFKIKTEDGREFEIDITFIN